MDISNRELIEKAASVINPKRIGDYYLVGDVGCALLAGNGKIYQGVCADVGGQSFCAETNAIGSMITDGEYRIRKIVATWKNDGGEIFVVAPCGHCREFMCQINAENIDADIIMDQNEVLKLKELYPRRSEFNKQIL